MESLRQIQFEELEAKRTFASAELQAGANANPWQPGRRQYKGRHGEIEVAYLSFDIFWDDRVNCTKSLLPRTFAIAE
jgi:hypothetical protein